MGALIHFVPTSLQLMTLNLTLILSCSSGVSLAYASLVQAPDSKLTETVSLGFCSDRATKEKLSQGKTRQPALVPGARRFPLGSDPCFKLDGFRIKGKRDLHCEFDQVRAFARKIRYGKNMGLAQFAIGFSTQKNGTPLVHPAFLIESSFTQKKHESNRGGIPRQQVQRSYFERSSLYEGRWSASPPHETYDLGEDF